VKKYFYIFLLIEFSFCAVVIEPESQIQNSIYYDFLDEESYYRIVDSNTSFNSYVLNQRPLKLSLFLNNQWSSDYLIQILSLHKNNVKYEDGDYEKIENYLFKQLR
tara:strand:+ start:980 stop:1297 length:318 start_codon:yes stop_codon:yes gene_type:complete